jgi:sporulation protein YlmC with PRC-barrel domain
MNKTREFVKGLLIVGLVVLLAGYVLAAEQAPGRTQEGAAQQQRQTVQVPGQQQRQPATQQPGAQATLELHRANTLIGSNVKNPQGENLGDVHDIVLTEDHQQVSYIALARGGLWGIGATFFAIPWEAVSIGPDGEVYVNLTEQELDAAEGFDRSNWPLQGDPRWARATTPGLQPGTQQPGTPGRTPGIGTQDRTGQQPGAAGQQQRGTTAQPRTGTTDRVVTERDRPGLTTRDPEDRVGATPREPGWNRRTAARRGDLRHRRVSHLTGTSVRNPAGEDIANVEDFVVDMTEGRIAYTVVSFGGFWGIGERYAVVPHTAVDFQPERNLVRLDATRETLEAIAFQRREFPDLTDRQYAQRVHQAFGEEPYWIVFGYVDPAERQVLTERAWGPEGQIAQQFDPQQVTTVKGTVESVGSFRPDDDVPGIADGLRLRVRTEDDQVVTVYAGPRHYAQQHEFFVRAGDEITVTGSKAQIGWRPVLIAAQIQSEERTLLLFDRQGRPLWQAMPGQPGQQRPGTQQQPGAPGQQQPRPGTPGQQPQQGTQPGQPRY